MKTMKRSTKRGLSLLLVLVLCLWMLPAVSLTALAADEKQTEVTETDTGTGGGTDAEAEEAPSSLFEVNITLSEDDEATEDVNESEITVKLTETPSAEDVLQELLANAENGAEVLDAEGNVIGAVSIDEDGKVSVVDADGNPVENVIKQNEEDGSWSSITVQTTTTSTEEIPALTVNDVDTSDSEEYGTCGGAVANADGTVTVTYTQVNDDGSTTVTTVTYTATGTETTTTQNLTVDGVVAGTTTVTGEWLGTTTDEDDGTLDIDPYGPSDNTELMSDLLDDELANSDHLVYWANNGDVAWVTDGDGNLVGTIDASQLITGEAGSYLTPTGNSVGSMILIGFCGTYEDFYYRNDYLKYSTTAKACAEQAAQMSDDDTFSGGCGVMSFRNATKERLLYWAEYYQSAASNLEEYADHDFNNHLASMFELTDENGKTYYAYCVDKSVAIDYDSGYELVNVGDTATIEDQATAAHISYILQNGWWGTAAENESDDPAVGSLDAVKALASEYASSSSATDYSSYIDGGLAVAMTQAALWYYTNPDSDLVLTFETKAEKGTLVTMTLKLLSTGGLTYTGLSDANLKTAATQLFYALINKDMDTDSYEDATTDLILEEDVQSVGISSLEKVDATSVEEITELVKKSLEDDEATKAAAAAAEALKDGDLYTADVTLTLAVVPSRLNSEDLTLYVYAGENLVATRRVTADTAYTSNEDGTVSYTVEDVVLPSGQTIRVNLSGTQNIKEGAYLYRSTVSSVSEETDEEITTKETSQTLAGYLAGGGTYNVDLNVSMKFDVKGTASAVEVREIDSSEETRIITTVAYGSEVIPTPNPTPELDPDPDPEPEPEDEIPEGDVPLADVPVVDVPEEDVPLADVPVADVPEEDVPLAETPEVEITDGDVPLADVPVADVPEEDVPLADVPEEDVPLADVPVVDVLEEDVPLADVPRTGDSAILWLATLLSSAAGLAWLALTSKKRAK